MVDIQKKMKVLLISEYFPPFSKGGGEISAYLLAKNLAKKIDISILTSYFHGSKRYEVKDNIKIYRRLKTGKNPGSVLGNINRMLYFENSLKKELIKICRKENFDIIHCLNMTSLSVIDLKKKIKGKFVAHINSPLVMCPKGDLIYNDKACPGFCSYKKFSRCVYISYDIGKTKNNFLIRRNPIIKKILYNNYLKKLNRIKKFDACFAISSFLKNNLIDYNKKVFVVPNIVDIKKFSKLKNNDNEFILYIGDYKISKGPHVLLEALKGTNHKAEFYGEGPLKKYLLKYKTKNVKIHDKVSYNKILNLYENASIIVFPSIWPEPFGRIAIEAMAAGKPIIASNIGGIKDIVDNNKNGIMVMPGNFIELKKAIVRLMENKKLRKKLGKEGRKKAKKEFNGKKISGKVIKLYKKIKNNET